MAYDALAESVELIESRLLKPVARLSRRRRFAAMSVDVTGDVAVTTFARRGVGCIWHDTHVFALKEGSRWMWLGGHSSNGQDDLLDDRPSALPAYLSDNAARLGVDEPGPIVVDGGAGGVRDSESGRNPGRWISIAGIRVNDQVELIGVADRILDVPWHGRVTVVWTGRRPPRVVALDRQRQPLAKVYLANHPRP
jgi:hypothetical protein